MVRLFSSNGKSDVVSWYRIWEAVEATFAVCARHAQGGVYRGLGQSLSSKTVMRIEENEKHLG